MPYLLGRNSYLWVFLITFALCAVVGILAGIPMPAAHDEFSYLLQGKIFSQGRLSLPSPVHWEFFETFHELLTPVYASKYPPLQSAFLALGYLAGLPILGVWLSFALMATACHFMFRAWLVPKWALAGTFLILLKIGAAEYWAQSYWGGAATAIGAGLILGAVRRLFKKNEVISVFVLAFGMVLLMLSRPFEGACASLIPGIVFLAYLAIGKVTWTRRIVFAFVFILTMGIGVLGLGLYNRAITGDPLVMPYMLYQKAYIPVPIFLFQEPDPMPEFRYQEFKRYLYSVEPMNYREDRTLKKMITLPFSHFLPHFNFLIGIFLVPALLNLPILLANRWYLIPFGICVSVLLGLGISVRAGFPHYYAPMVPALFLLITKGMQAMSLWRFPRPFKSINQMTIVCAGVIFIALAQTSYYVAKNRLFPAFELGEKKRLVESKLNPNTKHLVFVSYSPKHSIHEEWVYNEAPINSGRIIWARFQSKESNKKLINQFPDREIWCLNPDQSLDPHECREPQDSPNLGGAPQ